MDVVMKMLERSEDLRYTTKFACLDSLVPEGHLVRKIEKVIDFGEIYEMVEHLYCEDNGRPAVDPVVLVKIVLLQHLYGIKSLRQTIKDIDMNIAYRWFIGYDIDTPMPHFATVSYAFASRFPSEVFAEIFAWILEAVVKKGFVKAEMIFIDATHIKANANRKKHRKELAVKTARVYDERLREEINADRASHGKKPLRDKDDDGATRLRVKRGKSAYPPPILKAVCFTRANTRWSLHTPPMLPAIKTTLSSTVR